MLVPKNISLIYWDYYNTDESHFGGMLRGHQNFDRPVVFAGGAWSWSGFVPGNRFSVKSNAAAIRACLEAGVEDVFITCWKDDGAECSLFSSLPALYSAAQFARGNFNLADIAASFKKFTGVEWETFLSLDDVDGKGETLRNPSNLRVIAALCTLKPEERPEKVYGCEVWRNLDWMNDDEKVYLDCGLHPNLMRALSAVFDSQIAGGKRYDLAAEGRRLANATFSASHACDTYSALNYAMDLTPLMDEKIDIAEYIAGYIDRFKRSVTETIEKFV